ncbi:MAG: MFS transporter, partial [Oscillospiraceae bacterium]|nr:MFS transporter [Oscillospiraceae bacterium]
METKKKMGLWEKLGFGVFAGGYNLLYQFKGAYYLFFLTNVLGISVAAAGTLVAVGGIWDAVNDPLIAYYTVNHTSKKGEHIRYSLLYFAVPVAICLVLLFTNFHLSDTATIIIAGLAFFVYDSMLTFFGIGYSTMSTVATDDQGERTSLNIFRSVGSNVGVVIGTLGCFPILNALGALDAEGNLVPETADKGFFFAALIFGLISTVSALIHYFTT